MSSDLSAPPPVVAPARTADEALIEVVRQTCVDLHPDAGRDVRVALDSSFDRDLALDSLARVELLLRVERAFGIALPEDTLARAETPRDLLVSLRGAARLAWRPPARTPRA